MLFDGRGRHIASACQNWLLELQSACRLSKLVARIDCQEIDRLLDASGVEVLLVQDQWESVVVAIAVLLVSLLLLVSLVKRGRTEEQAIDDHIEENKLK